MCATSVRPTARGAATSIRSVSTMESTFTSFSQDVAYSTLDVDAAVDEWFAEAEAAIGG